jgi:hypothetical protein
MSFNKDYYGIPNLSSAIFNFNNGLIEFPLGCAEFYWLRIPFGGGCFFRLFPYIFTKLMLKKCNADGRSVMFYFHPWEIDIHQPKMKMPVLNSMRHYVNLDKTMNRLKRLLQEFHFTSAREVLGL